MNLRLLIICCVSSGDIYISLVISLSNPPFFGSFSAVSKLFFGRTSEPFGILSAILLAMFFE